jgi:23S rRNA pseudouridine1911/1915/1917 synthase
MQMIFYINDINKEPSILDETGDFAVVYKPPRMHSAPLKHSGGDTLLDWYVAQCPLVGKGGLLHRLDFETHGLVLVAKTQPSLDFLLTQQEQGNFIK